MRQVTNQLPTTAVLPAPGLLLQRKCDCGNHTVAGGQCWSCTGRATSNLFRAGRLAPPPTAMVPPVVSEVLQTPGEPLDAGTQALMENHFSRIRPAASSPAAVPIQSASLRLGPIGDPFEHEAERAATQFDPAKTQFHGQLTSFDFSRVRVHTGTRAAESALAVNARAYTVGSNIVFGAGQYAPQTTIGQRLLVHELSHTLQQGIGASIQRTPIDDARKKLSYAWNDWAITDADAMEALAFLGSIPPAGLATEIKKLEPKYVNRLLDNLPDAAKTGDVYQRIIQALGPAAIQPYAKSQLSYCFPIDLAITDAEVTSVFNLFANLDDAAKEEFLAQLDAAHRLNRLIDNSNTGHHALFIRPWIATLTKGGTTPRQRQILRVIVANTDNDAIETLKLATEIRFNVDVRKSQTSGHPGAEWQPDSLRRTYFILDRLPEAHVAANAKLLHLGQFTEPGTKTQKGDQIITSTVAGVYDWGGKELSINTEPSPDPEGTILHETGHSVDNKMGWSAGPEPANPKRGGWKSYSANYHTCADDMVDDSAGGIKGKLTVAQRGDVVTEMETAMSNRSASGVEAKIRALPWYSALKDPDKSAVIEDRALKALDVGLKKPWFNATDGGEHLGPHVYEESYANDWSRYRHEARARILSPYQFRQAPEWFAECYAFYYAPDPRGKGAKLKDKDPDTKAYFDNNVDTVAPSPTKP